MTVKQMEMLPDEPSFVLRAKDRAAVEALAFYREACKDHGSPQAHIDGINERIRAFHRWRNDHWSDVKVPD